VLTPYTPPLGGYGVSTYVVSFPRAQRAESFPRARITRPPEGRSIYVRGTEMAPLPPDGTARVWIDYHTCGEDHTALIRFKAPATDVEVADAFNAFVGAVGAFFALSTFIGARVAALGSNVSNPAAGSWPVSWGSGAGDHAMTAHYLDFVGRSFDGRRARIALFGCLVTQQGDDYRATSAESSVITDGVAVLNGTPNIFLSINEFQPVWYPYADMGVNAYWRNRIR